jgi:WD40 repeat protein
MIKHRLEIRNAVFNLDGSKILTCSKDSSAQLWDSFTGIQYKLPMKNGEKVYDAFFSPDGDKVVTISEEGTARIWSVKAGKPIGSRIQYSVDLDIEKNNAIFSPDSKKLFIYTAADKQAHLLKLMPDGYIDIAIELTDVLKGAAFMADGRQLLTISQADDARLWDTETGKQSGFPMKLPFVSFGHPVLSPMENLLASYGSLYGSAYLSLWNLSFRKRIGPLYKFADIDKAVFSSNGNRLVIIDNDILHLLNLSGDIDIPVDLFKLQVMAFTGTTLDELTEEVRVLDAEKWVKIKEDFELKSASHAKNCKYLGNNLWRMQEIGKTKAAKSIATHTAGR